MAKAMKLTLVAAVVATLALSMISATPAIAQDAGSAAQTAPAPAPPESGQGRNDRNVTIRQFDDWMNHNPEAAKQIRENPNLLKDQGYVSQHPELQKFMNDHPDFAKHAQENPDRVVHKANTREKMAKGRQHARRERKTKSQQ